MDLAEIAMVALGAWFVWKALAAGAIDPATGLPAESTDLPVDFGVNIVMDTTPPVAQSPIIVRLAQAIAVAEGFYVPGSKPARNHNPGDMTADLVGKAIGRDGMFVVYATDADGWANLYRQIELWLSGKSAHATANSTIAQIADFYTTTQQDIWAKNVSDHLGVTPETPIGAIA